jgi:flagellar export protein FliJ
MNRKTLTQYRAQLEDAVRQEFVRLTQDVERAEGELSSLQSRFDAIALDYLRQARSGMTVEQARAHCAAMEAVASAREMAAGALASLRRVWDDKREELVTASRETRQMVKLVERETEQERIDLARSEQLAQDEAAQHQVLRVYGTDDESGNVASQT